MDDDAVALSVWMGHLDPQSGPEGTPISLGPQSVAQAINHVARYRTVNPAQAYLDRCAERWDGIERLKMALGGVGWAAKNVKRIGGEMSREIRRSTDTRGVRKRAVARLSSVVHRAEKDLLFLNEVRNTLRALPVLRDEFTVVVAGYPNVGKSSFIRLVSSADPQVASYPFTTKGIIVGHRKEGRSGVQFVDTPGILDRPPEDRSPIERQAVSALMHAAHAVLFILDPSEMCGYPVERQLALLAEVKEMVPVPVLVAVNKADVQPMEGYLNMSTLSGDGVEAVLAELLRCRVSSSTPRTGRTP